MSQKLSEPNLKLRYPTSRRSNILQLASFRKHDNATSDSVRKHANTDMHRPANDMEMEKHLSSQKYAENGMKIHSDWEITKSVIFQKLFCHEKEAVQG